MKLRELLNNIPILETNADLDMEIASVAYDSRKWPLPLGCGAGRKARFGVKAGQLWRERGCQV